MRIFFLGLLSILLCVACSEQHDHKGKTPLVELDGNFLYREDLQSALPARLSKDDSLLFAEHYIRNWVEDVLLYEKAQSNIPDNGEIEKLVENYRKALIMHTYQQALIHQRLSNEISEGELADYYEKNKELFRLERPLMQGLFIKVPLTAPQLNNVRRWYKAATQDAVEHLEKYSLQNAVKYEYFYDKWVPMADVLDLIPLKVPEVEDYVNKNRHIELKDTAFYYFLNVSDFRSVGEQHVIPQIVMHIGAEKHVGKEGGHGRRRRKALRPSLPNASHRQFLPLLVPSKHSGADRKSQGRFRPFSICGIIRKAGWKEDLRCQRYFRGCVP